MTPEDINNQIQAEKDRHNRIINDLDTKKAAENKLHQQKMESLRSLKQQIKNINKTECLNNTSCFRHERIENLCNSLEDILKSFEN